MDNVNTKGVTGLIKVIEDLHNNNFHVFTPFSDYCPADLIALDNNGRAFKLQVKYRNPMKCRKTEKYEVSFSSTVNGKKIPINMDMIDGWEVYLSNSDKVVYVSKKNMINKRSMVIDPTVDYGRLAEW